jgi:hypothetical protein
VTGASAGCRCGRLCRMLGTHLLERSARYSDGHIRLAEPGVARRWACRPMAGGFSDAEKSCSKGLGTKGVYCPL